VYVLKADGTLYVWGYNGYGQLGIGSTTSTGTPTTNTSGVAALMNDGYDAYGQGYVSAGFIKKTDGQLYSAGYNGYGQLGVGDASNRTSWTRVLLPGNFTVAGMAWKTDDYPVASYVAYSTDGRAYCWGYNGHYGVTTDNSISIYAPVQMVLPWGG
jgi:alpha-tubulin suppressor-like RCC1 family protein